MVQPAPAYLSVLLLVQGLLALVRAQDACAYVQSGSQVGVPYHLAVTYLFPGLAVWNIMVPRPPECAGGYVAGHVTRVCDHHAAPRLRATPLGVLVQRSGWLGGVATVSCTVFCVFSPRLSPLPPVPAVPSRSKHVKTEPAMATTGTKTALSTTDNLNESESTIVTLVSSTLSSSSSEEDESVESQSE